jgi:hypothetical protein
MHSTTKERTDDYLLEWKLRKRPVVASVPDEAPAQKTPPAKSSRFVGVAWHPRKQRYSARIKVNRWTHHIGDYLTEEDAARAYDRMARMLLGGRARLNFAVPADPLAGELKPS